MTDGQISRNSVVAYGMWAVAGLLMIGMWIAALADAHDGVAALGLTGAACSAVAATAHVRKFLCDQDAAIRDAFELGRDSVHLVR